MILPIWALDRTQPMLPLRAAKPRGSVLAALAGLILAARLEAGQAAVAQGWELDVIAAVIIIPLLQDPGVLTLVTVLAKRIARDGVLNVLRFCVQTQPGLRPFSGRLR